MCESLAFSNPVTYVSLIENVDLLNAGLFEPWTLI